MGKPSTLISSEKKPSLTNKSSQTFCSKGSYRTQSSRKSILPNTFMPQIRQIYPTEHSHAANPPNLPCRTQSSRHFPQHYPAEHSHDAKPHQIDQIDPTAKSEMRRICPRTCSRRLPSWTPPSASLGLHRKQPPPLRRCLDRRAPSPSPSPPWLSPSLLGFVASSGRFPIRSPGALSE